jgi:hypothetical protein
VVPASTTENAATERLVDELVASGQAHRLEVVLVDRGTSVKAAAVISRTHSVHVRRVGWPDTSATFRPIAHAWRVEVAHGMLGRSRRLAKSFESTTVSGTGWLQVACIATILTTLRTI